MIRKQPVSIAQPGRLEGQGHFVEKGWRSWFPGWQVIRHYKLAWLGKDLAAGLVLTSMLVPVGIAYAVASGVLGIYGLYATIIPLLVYALFGPSRILVIGPDSSLAAIMLAVITPLALGDPSRAIALAGMMAVISGCICILLGVFRLGFITDLLSKPIRYGYMNGIALTVLVSQIPKLFGFSTNGDGLLQKFQQIGESVVQGKSNYTSLAIGLGTLMIILALKRFKRIPGILLAVIAATLTVRIFKLDQFHGVSVLGTLPKGLPVFQIPWISWADMHAILSGGFAVAMVAFADTSVLSRVYATKNRAHVDPNREMIGLGMANLAAGFFQGFPISGSSSRTPVAEASGAQTQLTGVIGAIAVALLLLFGNDLLQSLPNSALAAVVITSAIGLLEIKDLKRIYRIQRWEFWLSIGCFAGVAILGAISGIGLAVIVAIIEFLWDAWRPHYAVLGRAEGVRGYHDLKRYPEARLVPGLVLFRWDAPLFFANAEQFKNCVLQSVRDSPTPVKRVIVAAEPVTSVDITAADLVDELYHTLAEAQIELHFAEMKDPVRDVFKRFGLFNQPGNECFHPTVGAAVDSYLKHHSVAWVP